VHHEHLSHVDQSQLLSRADLHARPAATPGALRLRLMLIFDYGAQARSESRPVFGHRMYIGRRPPRWRNPDWHRNTKGVLPALYGDDTIDDEQYQDHPRQKDGPIIRH
jgi:hypothetical protein